MNRILLVDDERSERKGIRFLIDKYHLDLSVEERANGREALEYVRGNEVDILFTDVKMPHMDGLELALAVREERPEINIVIFSAFSEFEYAKKAMAANAVDYLLKPIDVEDFLKVMQEVILRCEERKQNQAKARKREQDDVLQALFSMLTGTSFHTNTEERVLELLTEKGSHGAIVSLETVEDIFLQREVAILNLLGSYAPYGFTYVNQYPNTASVILHSTEDLKKEKVGDFAAKLQQDFMALYKTPSSILISEEFCFLEGLRAEAEKMLELRRNMLGGDTGILFISDIDSLHKYYEDSIETCRRKIDTALQNRDMEQTVLQVQRLLISLEKTKALSLVYMHHIFFDLLQSLYSMRSGISKEAVQQRIDSVVQCNSLAELKQNMGAVLAEVMDKQDENDKPFGIAARVDRIIETEYHTDLGLDSIAERLNLSPAYVSFMYKQETGNNIVKRLSDYRMEQAKRILLESNRKINDIARACG